jgi:predicted transposase YdaD
LEDGKIIGKKEGREEGRKEGRKEGEEIGREKGKWENTVQTVLNSHKAGLPIETIAAITGLTPEKIKEII